MPHWDHMSDMADDFAVAKTALADGERSRRYLRRRILAVGFIPGFLLILYLVALIANGRG